MSKKPTGSVVPTDVPVVPQETLDKLASRDADIRASGTLDLFEQHLPKLPADYVFKPRDRQFVEDILHVAFDAIGGLPAFAQWGKQNPGEFFKLYTRLLPEAQKRETGPAVVQVFHNVPPSALDLGDVIDNDDDLDE